MLSTLIADFRIIFERDPAARNWLEVALCYPGLQALLLHRLAHALCRLGLPVIPRLISQIARLLTGIEIHPGATIGKGLFIDHGMGVVIGETAIIGDYALIYQGVTLGGTGKESGKRHPTLGRDVVVGAGAKVLGNLEIGDRVRIGAGSVVLRPVPSDCTVVGIPGRIVYRGGTKVDPLDHAQLPDSEARVIRTLVDRIEALEEQLQKLQPASPATTSPLSHQPQPVASPAQGFDLSAPAAGPSRTGKTEASPGPTAPRTTSRTKQKTSCCLEDREIEAFLDGAGI